MLSLRLHKAVLLFLFLIVFKIQAGDTVSHKVTVKKLPNNQVINSQKSNLDISLSMVSHIDDRTNYICHNSKKITYKDVIEENISQEAEYTAIKNTVLKTVKPKNQIHLSSKNTCIVTVTDL